MGHQSECDNSASSHICKIQQEEQFLWMSMTRAMLALQVTNRPHKFGDKFRHDVDPGSSQLSVEIVDMYYWWFQTRMKQLHNDSMVSNGELSD